MSRGFWLRWRSAADLGGSPGTLPGKFAALDTGIEVAGSRDRVDPFIRTVEEWTRVGQLIDRLRADKSALDDGVPLQPRECLAGTDRPLAESGVPANQVELETMLHVTTAPQPSDDPMGRDMQIIGLRDGRGVMQEPVRLASNQTRRWIAPLGWTEVTIPVTLNGLRARAARFNGPNASS